MFVHLRSQARTYEWVVAWSGGVGGVLCDIPGLAPRGWVREYHLRYNSWNNRDPKKHLPTLHIFLQYECLFEEPNNFSDKKSPPRLETSVSGFHEARG